MNSPFTERRQFAYDSDLFYYAAVITLPAKKLFKNIEYQNIDQKGQMFILNQIMDKMVFSNFIKYRSFEYHPNRNKAKPCLHANILFESLPDYMADHRDYFKDLKKITGSNMIDKICYFGDIYTEIDVINWINYMYKDYDDHFAQATDYIEHLIDKFHVDRYNERHKTTMIINDLDYK